MNILTWVIFGLIAGAIAKLLMPGKDPGGWIVTIILGIGGALVGGWLGSALWGSAGVTGFNLRSFGLAVLGSFILQGIYRLFTRRSGNGTSSRDRGAA